jgi:cysteine desulfuration protein SufE
VSVSIEMAPPPLDAIIDDLSVLDDWEDRYKYLIDLGRTLDPFPDELRTEENRVRGCASQVWLHTTHSSQDGPPKLKFTGESDAHIVRGLVALAIAAYSGKTADDILALDGAELFKRLDLTNHLTPQRSNGVRSLIQRIKNEAVAAAAANRG